MSSEGSRTTSSSSRLSQFGLYRSIDARTEEFLRLSRKRQIRQGCACAAVSTAITVTVVVVILLIYEYTIAVESSLVQRIVKKGVNLTKDNPIADRLDRSYFGFDQDYFERMPLLVNAMQEANTDQLADTTTQKPKARYIIDNYSKPASTSHNYLANSIRRTSPRPFYFEYKSPTPTPFSKTYGSRSWVDNYRNVQRMKNLQQVIQYLEKTINAKFGDIYTLPTSTIAFSGVLLGDSVVKDGSASKTTTPTPDLMTQGSDKVETYRSNHQQDPLYSFKPDSPGDVNLLADGFFRFSPIPTPSIIKDKASTVPMFRSISHRKRSCGSKCLKAAETKTLTSQESREVTSTDTTGNDKLKSFSVLFNLLPVKPTSPDHKVSETIISTQSPINKIYITTTRPIVQFRRRSTTPIRRTTTLFKRPRLLPARKLYHTVDYRSQEKKDTEPKMIVHVNLYPQPVTEKVTTTEKTIETTTSKPRYATEMPMLTSTQVEDYHVGSSGIIPIENRQLLTPAPPPPISTFIPTLPSVSQSLYSDLTPSSTETFFRSTNPPEIIKFSHEDAKVPDQYKKLLNMEDTLTRNTSTELGINRRNSGEVEDEQEYYDDEEESNIPDANAKSETTTKDTTSDDETSKETTTVKTYVPQINGHYRSVNQNSKNINSWLSGTGDNRKRRLEMSVAGFRKSSYVPQYVEIKRNSTKSFGDKEHDE